MKTILQNILAVLTGIIIGSIINMAIVMISGNIIPPPEGAEITTIEGLRKSLHLFMPQHFIMPFLAHALGTFTGSIVTALIAVNHKIKYTMLIGVVFLIGGTINLFLLPSPVWFSIVDLCFAYIPVAFIAGKFVNKKHTFLSNK